VGTDASPAAPAMAPEREVLVDHDFGQIAMVGEWSAEVILRNDSEEPWSIINITLFRI